MKLFVISPMSWVLGRAGAAAGRFVVVADGIVVVGIFGRSARLHGAFS